jgi:uncharacterized protein
MKCGTPATSAPWKCSIGCSRLSRYEGYSARRPNLFLSGHSHVARVERDPSLGLLHMNPRACGHNGWHTQRTVLRFSVDAEKIGNVELMS